MTFSCAASDSIFKTVKDIPVFNGGFYFYFQVFKEREMKNKHVLDLQPIFQKITFMVNVNFFPLNLDTYYNNIININNKNTTRQQCNAVHDIDRDKKSISFRI